MSQCLRICLKYRIPAILLIFLLFAMESNKVAAWTMAHVTNVEVRIEVAEQGPSRIITQIRFDVIGGHFHGFDFVGIKGGELVKEESKAALDGGRLYNLAFRTLRDGRLRVKLCCDGEVEKGGVSFALVHRVDFREIGALSNQGGRARLDWTLPIWKEGLHWMRADIVLPGPSQDGPIAVSGKQAKDYEITVRDDAVEVTKFRPVKKYPMHLIVDFDARLVRGVNSSAQAAVKPPAIYPTQKPGLSTPPIMPHVAALPLIAMLIGVLIMFFKVLHVHKVYANLGLEAHFLLLSSTGMPIRLALTLGAVALSLFAQYRGSLAAGVPALTAAVALWLIRRDCGTLDFRPGGQWSKMDDALFHRYLQLLGAYRRLRRTPFDIGTTFGALLFLGWLAGLVLAVFVARENAPKLGWAALSNGLIWGIPAWFSSLRQELPMDPTLEGMASLVTSRKSIERACLGSNKRARGEFWVREDELGPIEVRLRIPAPIDGLSSVEIGSEFMRLGTIHRVRVAAVLRIIPGTETSSRLADCPYAAEHYLSPDRSEEVVVLRNRRRTNNAIAPLRAALGMIAN